MSELDGSQAEERNSHGTTTAAESSIIFLFFHGKTRSRFPELCSRSIPLMLLSLDSFSSLPAPHISLLLLLGSCPTTANLPSYLRKRRHAPRWHVFATRCPIAFE